MTIKTAISLDQELFQAASATASEMNVSRSKLVSIALSEYLRKRTNRQRLEALNRVYSDEGVEPEAEAVRARVRSQRRLVEGTW